MKLPRIGRYLPSWKNGLLAVLAAVLLILAFPDFDLWFLAWLALVPLLLAVEREKDSLVRSFFCGWLFGVVFFFGTCWWLTYAPIHFAGFPPVLAYFLLLCVTAVAGVFPGFFALIVSTLIGRFGTWAMLAAPFVWVTTEFARYWITGNNWNAIGYSQAFGAVSGAYAVIGGILMVSFICVAINTGFVFYLTFRRTSVLIASLGVIGLSFLMAGAISMGRALSTFDWDPPVAVANIVAVQPNIPMSGFTREKWIELREHQIELAETALRKLPEQQIANSGEPVTVVLPESPMNYQWEDDTEFQQFISRFAAKNNVNVLFNSAEPDKENNKYFNSAVLIGSDGKEISQYDKIYLLPFGESVPAPLESIVPAFVGSYSYGKNYNLVPLGDANAGIMICFESHFGQLSREYVARGADVIIEMTNDGYLGPTPVLRQHLANAVFRAIETNRPVLRVTNVGITAYITERGEVLDATQSYTEDTRVWSVARSDGSQTFYVRYGDWFAWLCTVVTILMLVGAFIRRSKIRTET
jgi:apolipoprotein N-acyltransferase